MERYRSGHNEAVLKTVCLHGRVGSNPTLCVSLLIKYEFLKAQLTLKIKDDNINELRLERVKRTLIIK